MKLIFLFPFLLSAVTARAADQDRQFNRSIRYVLSEYIGDAPTASLRTLSIHLAEYICDVDQDVADEKLDEACSIIEDETDGFNL